MRGWPESRPSCTGQWILFNFSSLLKNTTYSHDSALKRYYGPPVNSLPAPAPKPRGSTTTCYNSPETRAPTSANDAPVTGGDTPATRRHLLLSQNLSWQVAPYPCLESLPYFLWLHRIPWSRWTIICSWPPVDRHLGCVQSFVITNKAAMTNLANKSLCTRVNTSVG